MSHRVRFSDNAVADLDGIAEHIAGDNPVRAISFIDELQRPTIDMLSVFPESGTRYKGLTRFRPSTVAWLANYDDGAPTSPGCFPD